MRGLSGWGFAAALGLLPLLALAHATPAQAQFLGNRSYGPIAPPPEMMPGAVTQRLSRAGYRVRWIKRRDGVFVVEASDRGGRPVRLVLDVAEGRILQRFAVEMDGPAPGKPVAAPHKPRQPKPKPRPQPTPVSPVPAPAPVAAPTPAPEQAAPEVQEAVPAAAPPVEQPPVEPSPVEPPPDGPGSADEVPINPLD